jgi:hypothetical protein
MIMNGYSTSSTNTMVSPKDTVLTLLKIDETAYDFIHNLTPTTPFVLHLSSDKADSVRFGEMIELLAQSTETAEFVLSSAIEFANQFVKEPNSMIIHVSTGIFSVAIFFSLELQS